MKTMIHLQKEIVLATAEMGFGHIRALYPLEETLECKLVVLGQNDGSNNFEKRIWKISLTLYESISRFKKFPILGPIVYSMMNGLLAIPHPERKATRVEKTFAYWLLERFIGLGLCKGLQKKLKSRQYLVTSFYAPVIALSKRTDLTVFCQICDSDLSRVWVAKNPVRNNTQYLVPCTKAAERLLKYGVQSNRIHLTGFPFAHELIGGFSQEIALKNYKKRMQLLDNPYDLSPDSPLKIAYIVGGAGVYSDIGMQIANMLKEEIEEGLIVLYLVAGIKGEVICSYHNFKQTRFPKSNNLCIVGSNRLHDYFNQFNELMSHIHILWTKPSELVFYSALGIPIIMTDPLGPQEEANRDWLLKIGAGGSQYISKYTNLWLMNRLNTKEFSRMAYAGWSKGIRTASYRIPEIIAKHESF
ncbi:MAG: hypothetical protein EHM93_09290 [Bacteroidales bacterium]|nr:MAG: hypothetical protein EHM93_09290 [Bacteroidales bacterium]